jgi:hypothetical protein
VNKNVGDVPPQANETSEEIRAKQSEPTRSKNPNIEF